MSTDDILEIKVSIRGIHERLDGISERLTSLAAVAPLHADAVRQHDDAINGDQTGLRPRVLRLEGAIGLMTWGLRAVWGVLVSLALLFASRILGE